MLQFYENFVISNNSIYAFSFGLPVQVIEIYSDELPAQIWNNISSNFFTVELFITVEYWKNLNVCSLDD